MLDMRVAGRVAEKEFGRRSQAEGGTLTDPLLAIGIFMMGATAGSLITYCKIHYVAHLYSHLQDPKPAETILSQQRLHTDFVNVNGIASLNVNQPQSTPYPGSME